MAMQKESTPHTLATLGPIVFALSKRTFEELTRQNEYRWAKLERLGRRPARQWIGEGDDQITFRGTVYPLLDVAGNGRVVGIWKIEEMRQVASQGTPLDFIDGMGNVYGRFCIEAIREIQTHLLDNGAPRKQEFDMSIARYGEDELGEQGVVLSNGKLSVARVGVGEGMGSFALFA